MRYFIILAITLIVLTSIISLTVAQPSETEAKNAFESLGCTVCHNGRVATTWDGVVNLFKESAGKYASLDEFVAKEIGPRIKASGFGEPKTWDELFQLMSNLAGKSGDPRVNIVKSYLASILSLNITPTTPVTETPITPTTFTPTPTTPIEYPRGEERMISGFILAIIGIVILVIISIVAPIVIMRR